MSYFYFNNYIDKNIKIIFELGSRDLDDAIKLINYYNQAICHSFECNPDCLVECKKRISTLSDDEKKRLFLTEKAISITNGPITFYPIDLKKMNNMGASSLLELDFTKRNRNDTDYNRGSVQNKINVDGTRLDNYMKENNIEIIDLLCIDLQGYELNALKSLGEKIKNVKYIITECSIESTYKNGANFVELNGYLEKYGFGYIVSNKFGKNYPNLNIKGFSEFDSLFVNKNMF